MSTQLKEKQQTKSKEQVPTRDLQADFHFNQHIFRTIAYTAAGFGLGMASSLLFKHKASMTIFFAGAGAGYGSAGFVHELNHFKNKRNPTEISKRQGGPSQFERTADSLKGDLQQAKNKVERGVENAGGKLADQVSQTARGAEEWARNASEKAQQHFQGKDYRRGGDDDKDDDNKSKKRDQTDQRREQRDQRREGDTQKKDLRDQKKEADSQKRDQKDLKKEAESLKKDLKDQKKEQDSQRRDQKDLKKEAESQKKDQKKESDSQKKDQKKESDSQRRDQKDLKKEADSQRKDQKDSQRKDQKGQEKEINATLKGGLSERAKREEGSKEHRMMGDMRADQFTGKMPDQNAFAGYDSPKQQWEGMNIKREDKSKGGQDKTAADVNKTYNKDGQRFQDFRSNPNEVGKAGEISEIKKDYQRNRNQAQDEKMDERRRASKHAEQDLIGQSKKQGLVHKTDVESETLQGFHNYQTGVAPGHKANQVNTKL